MTAQAAIQSIRVTAQNQFSAEIFAGTRETVAISLFDNSSFSGTITLQRSFDGGASWLDYKTYTTAGEADLEIPTSCRLRIGCKTGGYTSGQISAAIVASRVRS